jgi:hypothetical protein
VLRARWGIHILVSPVVLYTEKDRVMGEDNVVVEEGNEENVGKQAAATAGYEPAHLAYGGKDYRLPGNDVSGYIGVSPEYMNYANEYDKPGNTDYELLQHTDALDHLIPEEDEDEGDDETKSDETVDEQAGNDKTKVEEPVVVEPVVVEPENEVQPSEEDDKPAVLPFA